MPDARLLAVQGCFVYHHLAREGTIGGGYWRPHGCLGNSTAMPTPDSGESSGVCCSTCATVFLHEEFHTTGGWRGESYLLTRVLEVLGLVALSRERVVHSGL